MEPAAPGVPLRSGRGRGILVATVLGSGMGFLDSTVVNVALPAIHRGLHTGPSGLQWTVDAYLLTLSALVLLGGSLGDRYGRRAVFLVGLGGFVTLSMVCGAAPNSAVLIGARAVQGAFAALLVPASLAIISASFRPDDRSRAIGAWSGLAGVASAAGPLLGGWLIDALSWRAAFFVNLPLAAAAAWATRRYVPESRDDQAAPVDWMGALAVTVGLGGITYGLIEGGSHFGAPQAVAVAAGGIGLVAFVGLERRQTVPMLPLTVFRSAQFVGANLTTFGVYAGLGGALFLLILQLQQALHYSALAAGSSLLPFTALMLVLSPRAGALAQRIGARVPMTVGPLVAAAGLWWLGQIRPGSHYVSSVLPAVVVLGLGMTLTVAPLTAAVLGAVDERHLGVGSGFNNAVARVAGLVAVAALPLAAGAHGSLVGHFDIAMRIGAVVCALGGVAAALTVRTERTVAAIPQAAAIHPCHDPGVCQEKGAA